MEAKAEPWLLFTPRSVIFENDTGSAVLSTLAISAGLAQGLEKSDPVSAGIQCVA